MRKRDYSTGPVVVRTAGFTARQVQNDGLDTFARRRCIWPPWPAEVTQRGDGFAGEVVGGQPVVVHHSEGQTGVSVSVLFRTHMAARQRSQSGTGTQTAKKQRGTFALTSEKVHQTPGVASSASLACAGSWLLERGGVDRAPL